MRRASNRRSGGPSSYDNALAETIQLGLYKTEHSQTRQAGGPSGMSSWPPRWVDWTTIAASTSTAATSAGRTPEGCLLRSTPRPAAG